jgi:hypothetical protein
MIKNTYTCTVCGKTFDSALEAKKHAGKTARRKSRGLDGCENPLQGE